MNPKEHYYREWKRFSALGKQPDAIRRLQQQGMDQFQSLDLPTSKEEAWRFTNIAPLLKIPFRNGSRLLDLPVQEITRFLLNDSWPRLVFIDNVFSKNLSSRGELPATVVFENLQPSLNSDLIQKHLGRYVSIQESVFAGLNTAFLTDGVLIRVPERIDIHVPLQLVFLTTEIEDQANHPRILVIVEKGSSCSLVETHVSLSGGRYFSNAVTEIVLGDGSILEHCKLQQESLKSYHFSATQAVQGRDSTYSSFLLTLGSEISRNELSTLLDGVGSQCDLNGAYLISDHQLADHQTLIDHAKPHGTSHELYKGILDANSRGVFNGRIIVRKDALKTDSRQVNKNLLLSDRARINTKPQLEILADDVKCSHGAAIGHLEEDALFYLKTRGISDSTARSLLMYGFMRETSDRIKTASLRLRMEAILIERLREFAA